MNKAVVKKLLTSFKPEFGNPNHIRALELISKLNLREKLEKKKDGVSDEIEEVSKEMEEGVTRLQWLMQNKHDQEITRS